MLGHWASWRMDVVRHEPGLPRRSGQGRLPAPGLPSELRLRPPPRLGPGRGRGPGRLPRGHEQVGGVPRREQPLPLGPPDRPLQGAGGGPGEADDARGGGAAVPRRRLDAAGPGRGDRPAPAAAPPRPAALHVPARREVRGAPLGLLCGIAILREPGAGAAPERQRDPAGPLAAPQATARVRPAPDARDGDPRMSEQLFERYLRNDLDEAGARELSALLATEEGAREFSEFVQEWTMLGDAARRRVSDAERQSSRRLRRVRLAPAPETSRAWIGWAAVLAAVLLLI